MEKMLFWLVMWPWVAAVVVALALTQLPLGPWYLSAWLIIGAALLVMTIASAQKRRLDGALALRAERLKLRSEEARSGL